MCCVFSHFLLLYLKCCLLSTCDSRTNYMVARKTFCHTLLCRWLLLFIVAWYVLVSL